MNETLPPDHQIELTGEHIQLRAFRPEEAEEIYLAVRESKNELGRWLPWCHEEYTLSDTLEFLNQRGDAYRQDEEYSFAIVERKTGRFAGAAGINQLDRYSRRANLGYWLRTDSTGHGYATQAALLVARWAFTELGFQRLEIVTATGNVTSQRVAVRAGAVREGIARKRLRLGDEQRDAVVFSLVPEDLGMENGGA